MDDLVRQQIRDAGRGHLIGEPLPVPWYRKDNMQNPNDPRQTLPSRGLRAYELWRRELIAATRVLQEGTFTQYNMEDLGDFVEMVGTLLSFAPQVPEEKIAAREAYERGAQEVPRA